MRSVSSYLDVLQGDANCYSGIVLPTMRKVKIKIAASYPNKHCGIELRDGIMSRVDDWFGNSQRFLELFQNDLYVVAPVAHP